MKKLITLIGVIGFLITITASVLAGDIITPLMEDGGQVFFGEVKEVTDTTVTVIKKQNVKGEFEMDKEYTFQRKDFTTCQELQIGKIYLCTAVNEDDNFMIWEVTSTDPKTLQVLGEHVFAGQLEEYLNDGIFQLAEQERSTIGKQISLADFLCSNPLSPTEDAEKVFLRYKDGVYEVDKSKFFRMAEEIMITNVKNDTLYDLKDNKNTSDAYDTILYIEVRDSENKTAYFGAVSRFGEVDKYALFMGRLMAKDYEMKEQDLSKLYSLLPATVRKGIKIPEGVSADVSLALLPEEVKNYTGLAIVGALVVFVIAFAISFSCRKKK